MPHQTTRGGKVTKNIKINHYH